MDYYQEITLIDQAEISPYVIWSKLYQQLHIALAEIKDGNNKVNIGVSFPQYIYEEKTDHINPLIDSYFIDHLWSKKIWSPQFNQI